VRRPHLDWLRGIAVLIMIEAHTLDSWTRVADRQSYWYQWAVLIAGYGAPIFLFLAGITMMLAAGRRLRRGLNLSQATRAVLRRGAWIFALALLFRLQSFLISGGRFPQALLKVDILNVMGVSMVVAALAWGAAATVKRRVALFAAVTVAVAMATPLIRSWPLLDVLPDWLEAYLRPRAGLTNFTLFPWAAFFTAGCAVGAWLEARQADEDDRLMPWVAIAGIVLAAGGYGASFLPPIYAETSFWTSSPTFFFLRLGVLLLLMAGAYWLSRFWRLEVLQAFGQASLFVYWVHVELVYGVLSAPIHRRLPFPVAIGAFITFTVAMFGLVRLKDVIQRRRGRPTKTGSDSRASSLSAGRPVSRNSI
jgi:uncharacterized membrane protein